MLKLYFQQLSNLMRSTLCVQATQQQKKLSPSLSRRRGLEQDIELTVNGNVVSEEGLELSEICDTQEELLPAEQYFARKSGLGIGCSMDTLLQEQSGAGGGGTSPALITQSGCKPVSAQTSFLPFAGLSLERPSLIPSQRWTFRQ